MTHDKFMLYHCRIDELQVEPTIWLMLKMKLAFVEYRQAVAASGQQGPRDLSTVDPQYAAWIAAAWSMDWDEKLLDEEIGKHETPASRQRAEAEHQRSLEWWKGWESEREAKRESSP